MPDAQAGFRKERDTQDLIVSIHWVLECYKELQQKVSLCFIDYSKTFDCISHEKAWVALK